MRAVALLLTVLPLVGSAQDAWYLEGEECAAGRAPSWSPRCSGAFQVGPWEGTSRGRVVVLGEVPELGVAAFHLGDGCLPPGEYNLWVRLPAFDNDRSVALSFGAFGAGEAGLAPVGKAPDGGDGGGFHWQRVMADGVPGRVTVSPGKDFALIASRGGNDSPYVDCLALVPAESGFVPQDVLPAKGAYEPRIAPRIVRARPPLEPTPDPDLTAFRMAPVAPRPGEVSVGLHIEPTGVVYFPVVTQGRYRLYLDLRILTGEGLALTPTDRVVLRFRELFGGSETRLERLLPAVAAGQTTRVSFDADCEELPLQSGSHLVIADVVREGKSLCGGRVGAAELYVRRPDESRAHAIVSFAIAHAEFSRDRRYGGHFVGMKPLIPSTYDPTYDATWREWLRLYAGDTSKFLELLHDGGFGILHCAKVFRALGETTRAEHAERIVAEDMMYVLDKMVQEDGKVHCSHDQLEQEWPELAGGNPPRTDDILQNDAFVLKLAAQCWFHFRDVPGHEALLDRLMTRGAVLARHVCDPGWLPCTGCRVYDGRTISGQAWWVLAVAENAGHVPPEAETVLRNCRMAALESCVCRGWYDRGCLTEGGCHIGYGNQNLINALQPACRLADLMRRGDDMELFQRALRDLYGFLTETNAVITRQPMWMPSRHSSWSNGHMYVLCSEYLRDIADDPRVAAYRSQIGANFLMDSVGLVGGLGKWHGLNALATIIYSSPEYLAWEKTSGPLLF